MFHNRLRMRCLLCLAAIFPFISAGALAGTLTPGLEAAYRAADEQAKLPVLISLTRQANLDAVRSQFLSSVSEQDGLRHAALLEALQSVSRQSQDEINNSMQILQRNGMVEDLEFFWIANLLKANVSRAGAELIANFEAVEEVGLDEEINLLEPEESVPSEAKMVSSEHALQLMNAREIWVAGVTGTGTTVAVVGTPFPSSHLAFADRMTGAEGLLASSFCGQSTAILLGAAVGCDRQKGDTVGVAPDARWRLLPLACGQTHKVSDILRAVQLSQVGDYLSVPDVIVQAWSAGDSCSVGLPAKSWSAFRNLEELGSILIWSAGDNGLLGRNTVPLPAANVEDKQTFFSVGAVSADGRSIRQTSSRGPSPCDRRSIKPDLTAIGEGRSAGENGFVTTQGSLLATGYVAGAVALMRQVNPTISPFEAKNALKLSAKDLGVEGEDNDFGFGLLDINAAVELAASSSETGTISGTVKYGGERIGGARVYLVGASGSYTVPSNSEGQFRFTQIPAEREFALYVARFGYKDFAAPDSVKTSKQKEFSVGVDLERGIADDAEVDRGFVFGVPEDNATGGIWTRAVPVGSSENGNQVQVSEDATAYGSFCFVTGNGGSVAEPAAANDVDGGKTTLRSPIFRLDNLADSKLRFKYAYSNDRGQQKGGDFFRVQISNDGGETWVNLIQTSMSSDGWREASFVIEDFVTPTEQMVIQFVAEDNAPPSLVEAAVDDIFIDGKPDAPEPPKNLSLTPAENGVNLTWNKSEGASSYKLYLSGQAGHVFAPENYFTTVKDTFLYVPYDQIPYDQFYFQVTAVK